MGLADGEEQLADERIAEAVLAQLLVLELDGRAQARLVGLAGLHQRFVVGQAEAAGHLLVHPAAVLAMLFHLHALQVEALLGAQRAPQTAIQALRHQVVHGHLHGADDHLLQLVHLALALLALQVVVHIDLLDAAVAGEHAQRRRIGRQLVVRVFEVRLVLVVQGQHLFQLLLNLGLHQGVDVVEVAHLLGGALAQHHHHGALHVVAFLDARALGLGLDGPRGGDLQAAGPQDQGQIGPHTGILVGEHHHLRAVGWHVPGEVAVAGHHALVEALPNALYRQGRLALGIPSREELGQLLLVPGQEEIAQLVVVHRIGIRRVRDPVFASARDNPRINSEYFIGHVDRVNWCQ